MFNPNEPVQTPLAARLPQQNRLAVDADAEERVGLSPQVLTAVELRLAVQLVRHDVEVPVRRDRERVRPQEARVQTETKKPDDLLMTHNFHAPPLSLFR